MRPLPGLTPQEMEAWLAFLKAHAEVTALLDRELLDEHGISLAGYDVLAFLSRAEGRRMRMSDLAGAVLISPGAVTRRVEALEARGLVTRSRSTGDARVVEAALTEAGSEVLKELTPTHVRGVRAHFVDQLRPRELQVVAKALWRVAGSCEGEAAGSP
jgi:DNA-binding MarR family transcriptional regulator